MAHIGIDRTYINRGVRSRISWLVVLLVLTIVFGALGSFNVTGLAKDISTTYTSTTGEVVDEGTQQVMVGSRRNRHYEDRRNVTIEYSIAGAASSDTVLTDDLQIGDSLPIWVSDGDGTVRIDEPTGPGFWDWAWVIAVPIIALLLLWGFLVGVRTSIRLMRFTPEGRDPDFVFALQNVEVQAGKGRKAKKRTVVFHGVMQTNSVAKRVGAKATLTSVGKTLPPVQTYPPQFVGYYLKPGKEGSEPVLHAPEIDAWWTAVLAFPGDLDLVSAELAKPTKSD